MHTLEEGEKKKKGFFLKKERIKIKNQTLDNYLFLQRE